MNFIAISLFAWIASVIYRIACIAFWSWPLMLILGAIHSSAPVVPALGYWVVLGALVCIWAVFGVVVNTGAVLNLEVVSKQIRQAKQEEQLKQAMGLLSKPENLQKTGWV